MGMKTLAPQILTSQRVRSAARFFHASKRRLLGRKRVLHVFLEAGEPYSQVLQQCLPSLVARYDVTCIEHAVGPPAKEAASQPDLLAQYAATDAIALAAAYGLQPPADPGVDDVPDPMPDQAQIARGEALRARLGHYSSAMIWFEGEWYWGVDRLHHLEARLAKPGQAPLFAPRPEIGVSRETRQLDVFISFRSPYSYLAVMRIFDLAEQWQVQLNIRPVLPMVMRGLPVPKAKRFYIVRDCKREAERFGLPFGKICDPLGLGVERGLSLIPLARKEGVMREYVQGFLSAVFAEGVDAATDAGMRLIGERAGLNWASMQPAMKADDWRAEMEQNRQALFAHGLWGVPSIACGEQATFGQDRLWQVANWFHSP
jgi:2-hydroxychromene-2-carboxylate isomerase